MQTLFSTSLGEYLYLQAQVWFFFWLRPPYPPILFLPPSFLLLFFPPSFCPFPSFLPSLQFFSPIFHLPHLITRNKLVTSKSRCRKWFRMVQLFNFCLLSNVSHFLITPHGFHPFSYHLFHCFLVLFPTSFTQNSK